MKRISFTTMKPLTDCIFGKMWKRRRQTMPSTILNSPSKHRSGMPALRLRTGCFPALTGNCRTLRSQYCSRNPMTAFPFPATGCIFRRSPGTLRIILPKFCLRAAAGGETTGWHTAMRSICARLQKRKMVRLTPADRRRTALSP